MNANDQMIDKLAKVMMHVTDDTYERASRTAVMICFVIKFAIASAVYIALRHFNQQAFADLFMLLVFAFGLYGNEMYVSMKVKESIVKKALEENYNDSEERSEEKKAEDIEK